MTTKVHLDVEALEKKILKAYQGLKEARQERIREKITDVELEVIENALNDLLEQRRELTTA